MKFGEPSPVRGRLSRFSTLNRPLTGLGSPATFAVVYITTTSDCGAGSAIVTGIVPRTVNTGQGA